MARSSQAVGIEQSRKASSAHWMKSATVTLRDPADAAWRFLGAVKGAAHLRATLGLPAVSPEALDAHIQACVEDFLRAHRA